MRSWWMHNAVVSAVIRVAGGPAIGFGHVRRSWTLAQQLQEAGVRVRFVTASPAATDVLCAAGFDARDEDGPGDVRVTMEELTTMVPPRVCVVDDPTLSSSLLRRLAAAVPTACVDDTAERDVPVDLVVNGSAEAELLAYRGETHTRYLLGPDYLLLRPVFAMAPPRATAAAVTRVALLTGGGTSESTGLLLEIIADALPTATIDVVVGPFGMVPAVASRLGDRGHVHLAPPDVIPVMVRADLAVTAGGQTAYELAATGTPALGVRLAENQRLNLRGLERAGCLRDLGSPDASGFPACLFAALRDLAADPAMRTRMAAAGRRLVDGRGVTRVADALCALARVAVVGCGA